jgi:hypothetical protein
MQRKFWRVHCHIGQHPGQWQYWFREQCCALGWCPPSAAGSDDGWTFEGISKDQGWSAARNALKKMSPGDWLVATLPGHRVGRLGQVVSLAVQDEEWDPVVPAGKDLPQGENGRRILVRWELTTGPDDPAQVVSLPTHAQFNSGQLMGTIRELPMERLEAVRQAMRDESNWVSIAGSFRHETALSDYLSVHPNRLEPGMIAHPSEHVRERKFPDGTRSDVILMDRDGRVVIVECKQGAPTIGNIEQLRNYMCWMTEIAPELGAPRGMLVHGGSRRVQAIVRDAASHDGIELVYHELEVKFSSSK